MSQSDHKKTVLVVDDAPANIQAANAMLKDLYKVRIATNGAKALELVKVDPQPDLVLLDVMMPGMDGYEVCTRLKSDPATKDIPVIFLTGQTEVEDETRGFEAGAVDYIYKPFSPAIVKVRVHTHLMLRSMRQQLAAQLASIQKELETARKIQLSILPETIPAIAGLDIAARYLPMTAVAGDFYDFLVVDDKRIGILVADVSGHGMPAALIASMMKIAFAAQSAHANDPAQVLHGLNQSLCGKFQQHYVTAAYAYLDLERQTLTYAGAGHPPLLLWNDSLRQVRDVCENGLFLGKFKFAEYSSIEMPLSAGDWMLLYTDGIPETTNPAEIQFGDQSFRPFLADDESTSASQLVDRLLEAVTKWAARGAGAELDDDITLVAIHLRG
jgi:serine phosphatase RsbU (regulator of sigma subunit)